MLKGKKYDAYQLGFVSMVYKFFDKKFSVNNTSSGVIMQNQQLPDEMHKPIIRNYLQFTIIMKNKKYGHLLKTIFRVLMLQICD